MIDPFYCLDCHSALNNGLLKCAGQVRNASFSMNTARIAYCGGSDDFVRNSDASGGPMILAI